MKKIIACSVVLFSGISAYAGGSGTPQVTTTMSFNGVITKKADDVSVTREVGCLCMCCVGCMHCGAAVAKKMEGPLVKVASIVESCISDLPKQD